MADKFVAEYGVHLFDQQMRDGIANLKQPLQQSTEAEALKKRFVFLFEILLDRLQRNYGCNTVMIRRNIRNMLYQLVSLLFATTFNEKETKKVLQLLKKQEFGTVIATTKKENKEQIATERQKFNNKIHMLMVDIEDSLIH